MSATRNSSRATASQAFASDRLSGLIEPYRRCENRLPEARGRKLFGVFVGSDDDEIETDRPVERETNVEIAIRSTEVGIANDQRIEVALEIDTSRCVGAESINRTNAEGSVPISTSRCAARSSSARRAASREAYGALDSSFHLAPFSGCGVVPIRRHVHAPSTTLLAVRCTGQRLRARRPSIQRMALKPARRSGRREFFVRSSVGYRSRVRIGSVARASADRAVTAR